MSTHFLLAPSHPPSDEAEREFDAIFAGLREPTVGVGVVVPPVDLTGETNYPVWQLLRHAASSGRYALHGSGSSNIDEFEPRQSNDVREFGNRKGVYAAADGLWPMYFAIVDRSKVESLVNAAFTLIDPVTRAESDPMYFFSIDSPHPAPWRNGTVYLLPIHGFEHEADSDHAEGRMRSTQLFHPGAVRPVAQVRVQPDQFPLLDAIRRHDTAEVSQLAQADPDGFPWL